MKIVHIYTFCALIFVGVSYAAPKNTQKEQKPTTHHKEELSDEERDAMLITSGVGILATVISIFVDRHNISHVKTQLFLMLAGIQQFVSYMVRSPMTEEQKEKIVEELVDYLEEQWEQMEQDYEANA